MHGDGMLIADQWLTANATHGGFFSVSSGMPKTFASLAGRTLSVAPRVRIAIAATSSEPCS